MASKETYKRNFLLITFALLIYLPREGSLIDATAYNQSQQAHYGNEFLRRGHSHNDYHQDNPLESALRHGLRSVEVDVFPIENELLVGHSRFELDQARNIDEM